MVDRSEGRQRIHFLDELRGFLIIFVVWYHFMYDLYLFGVGAPWFFSPLMNNMRNLFVAALVIISGISAHLSRSNLRRGMRTLLLALGLSVVTYIAMPTQLIIFGILHFFGSSMLLYHFLKKPLSRIPPIWGFCLSVLLFCLTFDVYSGVVGIAGLGLTLPLPAFLYNQPLLYPLGFACNGLLSADYYPLIPWFFLFVAGGFCGDAVRSGRFPDFFYRLHAPWLAAVGQHTLLIYLLHQPILYGAMYLFFVLFQ